MGEPFLLKRKNTTEYKTASLNSTTFCAGVCVDQVMFRKIVANQGSHACSNVRLGSQPTWDLHKRS